MVSMNRLMEMARKWQRMAARGRRRISSGGLQRSNSRRKSATVAEKGHFVAYSADGKRYMLPLAYLQRPIFQELLKMAEEEFGLNLDGAITLPFDSLLMDYVISILHRDMSKLMEDALLVSCRCLLSSELPQSHRSHHLPLEGF